MVDTPPPPPPPSFLGQKCATVFQLEDFHVIYIFQSGFIDEPKWIVLHETATVDFSVEFLSRDQILATYNIDVYASTYP